MARSLLSLPPTAGSPYETMPAEKSGTAEPHRRMRILLFACTQIEAQSALKRGNGHEIAFLPSYEIEEIRDEITRFAPHLISCGTDFFNEVLSLSRLSQSQNDQPQIEITLPNGTIVTPATPRETKILSMLVQGKTNGEIAHALNLSTRTVKRTLSTMFERLGVVNRTELSNRTATIRMKPKSR